MAILVTGGAGYIGSHTCVELLEKGEKIVVVDNFDNSSREALERVKELTGRDFCFYEGDIRDKPLLEAIFHTEDIECVIHFAGLKAVGESCEKPLLYFDNNVGGTIALCQVMAASGVKKLIFSSSATVYGQNPVPYREEMTTGGVTNPYGRTKLMIEEILGDLCKADPDWSVSLLRYFNPVGAHPSGRIGENPAGIPNNLMPYITQVAVGQRDKLTVFGNDYDTPDGTGVRDYIHVVDLAVGHVKALSQLRGGSGLAVHNLGTGQGYSVLELITTFEEASGKKIPYEIGPRRAGDIAVCYADPAKARDELNFTASRNLADMCRDSWNWQRQNPKGYEKNKYC